MGIILLPLGALVVGLYLWVVVKSVRWVYGMTHSVWAGVGAVVFLGLLPIGDTIVNRWYHENVLCTRDEVGLHVFARVKLPSSYYDHQGRFKEPDRWFSGNALVDGRYQRRFGYVEDGVFPFTAHEKRYSGVFDLERKQFISYEVDYWTKGGGWWLTLFRPIFSPEDYLIYVRGIVNGVNCSAARHSGDSRNSSINAVFGDK